MTLHVQKFVSFQRFQPDHWTPQAPKRPRAENDAPFVVEAFEVTKMGGGGGHFSA